MKIQIRPSGIHAVFAVDPGRTTGVAAGYVDLKSTLKQTLQGITRRKAIEVSGEWLSQAEEIAEMMWRFTFTANVEQGLPLDHIHVVCEDFVLRRQRQGGATGDLTSIWVGAAAVGAYAIQESTFDRDGSPGPTVMPTWQQASPAKTLATNERLKLWGLYEVGSEHKRDAWRHFALRVNNLLGTT